jgi:glycosyltransferase involved in cell wall biosynthesis
VSSSPTVSVVMSVYNSAGSLTRTLDSILLQEGVDFEFIVIDDGSTDGSGEILDQRAALDARLVVVHQDNAGLTAALKVGCELARGVYIARQDAGGDISMPSRLAVQLRALESCPEAVMVSCGTRFVGPDDEFLFDVVISEAELLQGLNALTFPGVRGPSSHPSTMFKRDVYSRIGGYRPAFVVAQDMDLWLRMIEAGRCLCMTEVLYQTRYALGSVSSRYGDRQREYGAIAVNCARQRRAGASEPMLPPPPPKHAGGGMPSSSRERASFHYFIGCCLQQEDPTAATEHFREALAARPMHLGARLRLLGLRWLS